MFLFYVLNKTTHPWWSWNMNGVRQVSWTYYKSGGITATTVTALCGKFVNSLPLALEIIQFLDNPLLNSKLIFVLFLFRDSPRGLEFTEGHAETCHLNFDWAYAGSDVRRTCFQFPHHQPIIFTGLMYLYQEIDLPRF